MKNIQAFPEIKTAYCEDSMEYTKNVYSEGGMTILDYFAGQADYPINVVLDGMRKNKVPLKKGNVEYTNNQLTEYRAKLKYLEAKAMLKERENRL